MKSPAGVWFLGGGALLVASAIAAYVLMPVWLGVKVDVVEVRKGPIIQTIVATGSVVTPSIVNIGSQITGNVNFVGVDSGDTVQAGDVLITMDKHLAQASLDEAQASLRMAKARLAVLTDLTLPTAKQLLAQAKATEVQASQQLARVRMLAGRTISTPQELEGVQQAFDIATSQRVAAEFSVASKSPGGAEHVSALSDLAVAQAAVRQAEAQIGMTTIRSPVRGTVIKRSVEQGMIVQAGLALLVIAPAVKKELVVQIDERNLSLIKTGQTALGSADAYADKRFNAVLASIDPAVDADRGSVEVKLSVAEPPDYLKEDMTVSVDIEVANRKETLILVNDAIRDAATTPYVLLAVDGRVEKRTITLGIRGTEAAEVLDGVKAGDRAILTKGASIVDGATIRLKAVEK